MWRCDSCGGKLGLVVHRKWGRRFCRLTCKTADESRRRDEVRLRRRCGVPTIYGKVRLVLSVAAVLGAGSVALAMAQHPAHDTAPSLQAHVPISADAGNRVAPEPGRSAQMRAVYFEPGPETVRCLHLFCVRAAERIERKPHAAGGVQVSPFQSRAEYFGADHFVDQRRADAGQRPADERDRRALRADRNKNCCRGATALRCFR